MGNCVAEKLSFKRKVNQLPDLRVSRRSVAGFDEDALCFAVVEPIWPDFSRADEREHISQGTPGQQAIFYTMIFAREVDNGGFRQFFSNSMGIYWPAVERGLDALGAEEHLAALESVSRSFANGNPPARQSERKKIAAGFSKEELENIALAEDRIYNLGGFEQRLVPYWKAYIDGHPEEFFL